MTLTPERKAHQELRGAREIRSLTGDVETRSTGGLLHFTGYAAVTGVPYDVGSFREQVQRGAFRKTLSEKPDVQLLANHSGLPISRSTIPTGQPGSLTLTEDATGLHFAATADASDPDAVAVHRKIKAGLLDQMSFAFVPIRDTWDDGGLRTLHEVSIHRGDISIVNQGASPTTSVSVRSLLAQRGIHTPADGRPLAYYQGILRRHQLYAEFSDRLHK